MSERKRLRRTRVGRGLLLATILAGSPQTVVFASTPGETLTGFRDQVASAERLVGACAGDAGMCKPENVPANDQVSAGADRPAFDANWDWLRGAVGDAKKQPSAKRAESMRQVSEHLAELGQEAGGVAKPDHVSFREARVKANRILSTDEFRADEGPSWLDRQIAKVEDWIGRAFVGMESVGARNPWIATLIEWTCFGLAAGGLVVFVRRSLGRQSLRIALGEPATARRGDRQTTDWAQLAEARAATGDWRDGVHCLYWAAVVSLEARNAWRPNPTRTPREYLRLLRPGSQAQSLLRELTAQFERVWYGQSEIHEADFRAAQASLAALRSADLRSSVENRPEMTGSAGTVGTA